MRHVFGLCFLTGTSCFAGKKQFVGEGFAGCVSEGFLACWGRGNSKVTGEDVI